QLEHHQRADVRLRHPAHHLVAEVPVEGDRRVEVVDPQADVERPHGSPAGGAPITGNTRWVTRSPWMQTVGSPSGTSAADTSPKNGRPPPMTTGTRSIATASSSPSSRHCPASVPAVTA